MPASKSDEREAKNENKHRRIIDKVLELITIHGPMSAQHIEREYAGTTGLLQTGEKAVRASLARAVEEDDLVKMPGTGKRGGGGELLSTDWNDEDDAFRR